MSIKKALGAALSLAFALTILTPAARAGMRDQATEITFNQPVQVPGRVLPAGTYWFVLSTTGTADRDTVQISSSEWSKVYATVMSEPVERNSWTGRSAWDGHGELILAQRPSGQPEAVVEWFYPGRVTGHQFIYPSPEERQLQQVSRVTLDLKPAA